MATTKITTEMVEDDLKKEEFSISIEDPAVKTYPISLSVNRPFLIKSVYYTVTSSDDTGVCQFDLLKDGSPIARWEDVSVDDTIQFILTNDAVDNAADNGDKLELRVDSVGGTDQNALTVTFHILYT